MLHKPLWLIYLITGLGLDEFLIILIKIQFIVNAQGVRFLSFSSAVLCMTGICALAGLSSYVDEKTTGL